MRIRSKFIDGDGSTKLDEIIPANSEGEELIESKWVKSFREMMMNALKQGEDVTIIIKRATNPAKTYVI